MPNRNLSKKMCLDKGLVHLLLHFPWTEILTVLLCLLNIEELTLGIQSF